MREYILVDQYHMRVEYFQQTDEKTWKLVVLLQPEDELVFESLNVSIPLAEIYRGVTLTESSLTEAQANEDEI